MKQHEKKSVIKRYSDRLKEFGDDPQTLGWTKGKHFLRYHILLSQWEFKGDTLLDFGCGFGDMCQYISEQKLNIKYTGVDINKDLVETGKTKYPKANLLSIDIFNKNFKTKYDYVVCSGVHNLKLDNNWLFIENTFKKFSSIARKGFAINFISDKVDFTEKHLYNTNPGKLIELVYKYSNKVVLRNDYMPFEFTIFVGMDANFDKKLAVYPEFLKYLKK